MRNLVNNRRKIRQEIEKNLDLWKDVEMKETPLNAGLLLFSIDC
jgi:hypothetical protein